jgi:hypothetical protein
MSKKKYFFANATMRPLSNARYVINPIFPLEFNFFNNSFFVSPSFAFYFLIYLLFSLFIFVYFNTLLTFVFPLIIFVKQVYEDYKLKLIKKDFDENGVF